MISQDKLAHIAVNTGELVTVINESISWVNQFLQDEDKSKTNYSLKEYRRKLNKVKAVVTEKPVIALFGASQVGKSYMANNLLYNKDNKLMIYNHAAALEDDKNIDFMKYINSEGKGNEATVAVTRFTATIGDTNRLPIKIKILSPKDIVCVLCDTYYYDFNDKKPLPKKEEINSFIDSLKNHKTSVKQTIFTDDDVYEVKEYVEKYFSKNTFIQELEVLGFWDNLAELIPYISSSNWVRVFEFLWNSHIEIGNLFESLITYLSNFDFPKQLFVNFDALMGKSEKAIIKVETLLGFFKDTHSFQVQTDNGKTMAANSAKLCFVTSEIVLCVSKGSIENRPFIEKVDIIDFPGARSRPEVQNLLEQSLLKMLFRGKVSYLFNSYSSNFKSNTLSVCMRTSPTDVRQVPRLINQWIGDNLGEDATERTKNLTGIFSPLFIIFTWWNMQLAFKAKTDNPNPAERLTKLFETQFWEEIIGDYKWHKEWIYKDNQLKRFTNFYLLRNFSHSSNIFANKADYTEKEQFTSKEQEKFHQDYFTNFLNYHKQHQQFFENPEENFREASTANKDGSELIIKNLVPVSSNAVSVPIYVNHLNKALANAKTELAKHYHNEQADDHYTKQYNNVEANRKLGSIMDKLKEFSFSV